MFEGFHHMAEEAPEELSSILHAFLSERDRTAATPPSPP